MFAAIINTYVYVCMFNNFAGQSMQSIAPCVSTFTANRC